MDTLRFLDIMGFAVGLIYLILEYRASIWLWLAGLVMPAVDMVLYYKAGLYADFGMAVYYCLAAVYGFLSWKVFKKGGHASGDAVPADGGQASSGRPITRYPRSLI